MLKCVCVCPFWFHYHIFLSTYFLFNKNDITYLTQSPKSIPLILPLFMALKNWSFYDPSLIPLKPIHFVTPKYPRNIFTSRRGTQAVIFARMRVYHITEVIPLVTDINCSHVNEQLQSLHSIATVELKFLESTFSQKYCILVISLQPLFSFVGYRPMHESCPGRNKALPITWPVQRFTVAHINHLPVRMCSDYTHLCTYPQMWFANIAKTWLVHSHVFKSVKSSSERVADDNVCLLADDSKWGVHGVCGWPASPLAYTNESRRCYMFVCNVTLFSVVLVENGHRTASFVPFWT